MDLHDRRPATLNDSSVPALKLAGRYRLTSFIGTGGFTDMWQAEDEVLGRAVAVKMLRRETLREGAIKRLFRVEALASARLMHANITSVFDTGEHDGVPFLVMEYLGGGSLRDILDNGPINPLRAAAWAGDICSALGHAHQSGIVHGDIRPENILFTEGGHLKVSDFAIARATPGSPRAENSASGAHSVYACPEANPDARGDLYSLGVVLFECLIGQAPDRGVFSLDDASEPNIPRPGLLRPGIPMELDAAILKLLAADPTKRFQSARSVKTVLEGLVDDAQPAPKPVRAPALPRTGEPGPARPVPAKSKDQPAPAARQGPPAARQGLPAGRPGSRPTRRDSFLRSEGRWLLPAILVIAAAVGTALALPSVRDSVLDGLPFNNPPSDEVAAAPLRVIRSFAFDPPPGDGTENSGSVPQAFDGNQSTSWATSSYRTADFGRLKDGVGIAFDLGSAQELTGVRVTSVTGGWEGTVRFSDDGQNWSPPSGLQTAGNSHTFAVSGAHRYWMIWITNLVITPGEGTTNNIYAVAIQEIEPLSE